VLKGLITWAGVMISSQAAHLGANILHQSNKIKVNNKKKVQPNK